jgi:hypothetical protein
MAMHKYLLLVFTFLGASAGFSQRNFIPGYVIPLQGDTIHGLVDYRNWTRNPKQIHFKSGNSGAMETLDRRDIKEFGVENDKYISAIVGVESSPRSVSQLHFHDSLAYRIDTVFLQVLVQGTKSLYNYSDKLGYNHLYIGDESAPQALGFKLYSVPSQEGEIVRMNRLYAQQLADYMKDWPEVIDVLRNLAYDPNKATAVLEAYYAFLQTPPFYVLKREKPEVHLSVLGGMVYSSLDFKSVNPSLDQANFRESLLPTGGLALEATIPRSRQKWSIATELMLAHHAYLGRYLDIENSQVYTEHFFVVKTTYLKVNAMIRYSVPVSFGKVFANAGFSNGFALKTVQMDSAYKTLYGPPRLLTSPIIEQPRTTEQNLFAGLGMRVGKLSLECRYERGNGFSRVFGTGADTQRLWAVLGWRF